tara:strand:+ start:5465 stop:6223 length:759 start_codon:yes stop_codon:yes gene_type:complete
MPKITTGTQNYSSNEETNARTKLYELFKECPIPDDQVLSNIGLFLNSKDLSRILFMDFLFRQVSDVQGVVFDFGTRWGQNAAIFAACRGLYEPFNRHRKIVAFDTFAGFPSVHEKDGASDMMTEGSVSVTKGYDKYLSRALDLIEQDNPISHIKKNEVVVGDTCIEIDTYLERNPHTIVALAYFDFDIYEPTKKCLDAIKDRLVKGSVVAFDELNDHDSPGETLALMETIGLRNITLKRHPYTSRVSYFVVE